jgi:mevalonate kinase|tara:strand:+ start:31 stop:618 length:588 start_codon:yes stop_codon:yes gene_type:complete
MKQKILGIILSIACYNLGFGQELQEGQKRWNSENKLTIDDFKIKISDSNNEAIYSQFMISYSAQGFDFLRRNINNRIENLFLGNASWIDTTKIRNIDKQIEFQQTQFNLAEIQARNFRKRLFIKKWKISKGFKIMNKISNEIMAEFSEKRLKLMRETESGRNQKKLTEWNEKITNELEELYEFRFENKKRIKRKK